MGGATAVDTLAVVTVGAVVPVVVLIRYCWQYRYRPAFRWLLIGLCAIGVWTVARGVALFSNGPRVTVLFTQIVVFSMTLAAICWFLLAVESVFREPVPETVFAALLSVPLVTQFLGLLEPRLLYRRGYVDDRGVLYNELGPWLAFDLHVFAPGLALAAVCLWVGRALTGRRQQRLTATVLVVGTLLLVVPPALHAVGLAPEAVEATPVGFFFTGALFLHAFRWQTVRRFQLGPGRDRAFDRVDEAICILEENGRIIDANSQFETAFDTGRLLGAGVATVLPDADGLGEAIRRGVTDWSVTFAPGDGERYFDLQLSRIEYGTGAHGYTVVLSDVTELKRRARQLRRQNQRLDRFTSVVSHDIRNPLSVASGHLELLKQETDSDHVESIDGALGRIDTLIEETLTLARQGRTVAETEAVALGRVCERCWARVETGGATLTVVEDCSFRADPGRVEQVFENLFRNAVEHCHDEVVVTVGRLDGGFYIADDGSGIPADERETVFDFGYTSVADGTGYGLAIVERIASAHGWDVTVSTSEFGGTQFEFDGVECAETAAQTDADPSTASVRDGEG